MAKNLPAMQEAQERFNPWVRQIPWSRKWQPAPVFLPGNFHGQSSLAGYSPWHRTELDMIQQASVFFFFFFLLRVQSLLTIEPRLEIRSSNSSVFPLTVMREVKTLHCQQPAFTGSTNTQGTHYAGCIIIICCNFTHQETNRKYTCRSAKRQSF